MFKHLWCITQLHSVHSAITCPTLTLPWQRPHTSFVRTVMMVGSRHAAPLHLNTPKKLTKNREKDRKIIFGSEFSKSNNEPTFG